MASTTRPALTLTNAECSMQLSVLNYSAPAIVDDYWDSNWLQIRLDVQHPRGNWRATSSCVRIVELSALADWLDAINRKERVKSPLEFMEPNISFALVNENDARMIRVFFELNLRPPWAPAFETEEGSLYVDFPTDSAAIKVAIADLHAQLERTPMRALDK